MESLNYPKFAETLKKLINKIICTLLILVSYLQLKAQNPWYRVDDPESKTCYFIDTFGKQLPIGVHDKLKINEIFSGGLICINFKKKAEKKDAWGCLNEKGDTIISGKYLEPFYFYNGVAKVSVEPIPLKVSVDGDEPAFYCKFINTRGELIIDKLFEGDNSYDMDHSWTVTKFGIQWYILSKNGKLKELSVDYAYVTAFSNGLAKCKRMNHYTVYIDTTGWPAAEIRNENYTGDFFNGFAEYSTVKGKFGFINKSGQPVSPCIYDEVSYFSENLAAVKMYGKWGFIDEKGKIVIKPEYDATDAFYEGLACVCSNGKCGFINKLGKLVIPLKFNTTHSFFPNGLAAVSQENNKWGFINKKGDWVIKPHFIQGEKFDQYGFSTVFYTDKNSYKKGKIETYEKALISKHGRVVWCSGEKLILK